MENNEAKGLIKTNTSTLFYFYNDPNNIFSHFISSKINSNKSYFRINSQYPLDVFIIKNESLGISVEDFLKEPEKYSYLGCLSRNKTFTEIYCDVSYGRISLYNPNENKTPMIILSNRNLYPPKTPNT